MNIGHNSEAGQQLLTLIERIERLREEKAAIGADEKEVFGEAKGEGYDTKAMRAVLKIRATDRAKWQEAQAIVDTYLHAIGFDGAPLFKAQGEPLPVDAKARKSLAAALKGILPEGIGSVTIETEGAFVRLNRGADGEVTVQDGVQ